MFRKHLSGLGLLFAGAALVVSGSAAGKDAANDRAAWITHPDAKTTPVVLEFRRDLELGAVPRHVSVRVSADNRYVLFVNGTRVRSGPSTSPLALWRVADVDLARYLRAGNNEITALVWNFGEFAPLAQQSAGTGFFLTGGQLDTGRPGWSVRLRPDHTATSGPAQFKPEYYVASAPEIIDARLKPGEWSAAVRAAEEPRRRLNSDGLSPQRFESADPGRIVRASLAGAEGFPRRAVVVPARTTAKLLLRRDSMISAYPELLVEGGRDARITTTYAEALYDTPRKKVDRDLVGDRPIAGLKDLFIADGSQRSFATLWWRTWRYLELDVTTADEPLTLAGLNLHETGYPFEKIGRFDSDDEELDRIFEIGWRTLQVDAHETFMDSSYWEQLQYAGDTRLEMLISYAMSGQGHLAAQAIEAFAVSEAEGGIMQGAFPSRGNNVITTFSLAWIGMLHDWWRWQVDPNVVREHLGRVRPVLAWFGKLRTPSGLLGANPHWNFIDWAGQRWDDRTVFPSYGQNGGSCLMTVLWLGALYQAAELEREMGTARDHLSTANDYARQAEAARTAIREQCWDAKRGLFADNPDRNVFSQHMNALAVLHDVATKEQAPGILDRIVVPGRGIDAPEGMFTTTYYFAWYLVRAFEHAGRADRYFDLLKTWRDLLKLNYTTWPESRGDTRSDTHAWSAHPTADLLGIVAGIQPGAARYAHVRIEPHLGHLTRLDATAATPYGPVTVSYRVRDGFLEADIRIEGSLGGVFVWQGKEHGLRRGRTTLRLPLR